MPSIAMEFTSQEKKQTFFSNDMTTIETQDSHSVSSAQCSLLKIDLQQVFSRQEEQTLLTTLEMKSLLESPEITSLHYSDFISMLRLMLKESDKEFPSDHFSTNQKPSTLLIGNRTHSSQKTSLPTF